MGHSEQNKEQCKGWAAESFRAEVIEFLRRSLNLQAAPFSETECCNALYFPKQRLSIVLIAIENHPYPADSCRQERECEIEQIESYLIKELGALKIIYLYEDRWRAAPEVTRQRVLCSLGCFKSVYARSCKLLSYFNLQEFGLSRTAFENKIKRFLTNYHSYGYLKSDYLYALLYRESIVAAASFSKLAGPNSYEWTRYASLPDMRVAGGMGKICNAFLEDIKRTKSGIDIKSYEVERYENKIEENAAPIEIITYSDCEWGNGEAYAKLGFKQVGGVPPIIYHIDMKSYKRLNQREFKAINQAADSQNTNFIQIRNRGSIKWRKLYSEKILNPNSDGTVQITGTKQ